MTDYDISSDTLKTIATFLRKYARAVESKLYINMKVQEASTEILIANTLAIKLDTLANSQYHIKHDTDGADDHLNHQG